MAALPEHARPPAPLAGAEACDPDSLRLAALWPALLLVALGFLGLVAGTLTANAVPGQYLILAAPWRSPAQMLDMVWRADGGIAGFGALPGTVIAMANRPDFAEAARAQGAWLVLPAPTLLGCGAARRGDRP